MKLYDIAEAKALKVAEMRSLLSADKLNSEGQTKFDSLKKEVTDLEGQEARARFLDDAERRSMGEPDAQHRDNAALENKVSISRILQSQMEGRSLSGAEAEFSQEAERRNGRKAEGVYVPLAAFEKRGTVNTTTTGNDLVGVDHRASEYIGPLRNNLLARTCPLIGPSEVRNNRTAGPQIGCACPLKLAWQCVDSEVRHRHNGRLGSRRRRTDWQRHDL
jgi:hypothetical protein